MMTLNLLFFIKALNYRECTSEDYLCVHKNKHLLSTNLKPNEEQYVKFTGPGMNCPCLRNCNTMLYQSALNSLPLSK